MSDLAIGYVIIAALAAGLFFFTCWATRSWSSRSCNLAAIAVVALLLAYIRTLWYDIRLAELLPYSNLIVVGNWLPLFAAVLGGLVWRQTTGAIVRRSYTTAQLAIAGTLAAVFPLLGVLPKCGDHWDKLGTCLQTTNYTCSPAAAATLLHKHGIPASEQEMAALCLTRHGTSWQGLYRGLKLKTAGTQWDVQVCRCSVGDLDRLASSPMILSVGLEGDAPADTEFSREFGWVPGVSHSVVLEGFSSNRCANIADPAQEMSREQWDAETLRTLWRGYAFRLVRRGND
jgi:hypothetical protein